MGYKRLSRIQTALVGSTALLVLSYGSYHVSHRGPASGIAELTAFVLLMLALLLPDDARKRYHRLGQRQLILIGTVAGVALAFGLYHLSTPDGKPSGVLELLSFTLLAIAVLAPFRSPGN